MSETRSLVSLAFEAFKKHEQATGRVAKAAAELKRWTRVLNDAETKEYGRLVEEYRLERETR